VPATIFIVGLVISAAVAVQRFRSDRMTVHTLVEANAADVATMLESFLSRTAYGLLGGRAMMEATGIRDRETFYTYVERRKLAKEFPGVFAFGFVEPVGNDEVEAYVARERAEGSADLKIHPTPPHDHGTLIVVRWAAPQSVNKSAIGLNILSEPRRAVAIRAAIDSGQPTMTAGVPLPQTRDGDLGSFVYVPIVRSGAEISASDPFVGFQGAWYAAFRYRDVLSACGRGREVAVMDRESGESWGPRADDVSNDAIQASREIEILGRSLQVTVWASPAQMSVISPMLYAAIMAAGAVVSAAAAMSVRGAERARADAELIVEARTAELRSVIDGVPFGLSLCDMNANVLMANRQFDTMQQHDAMTAWLEKSAGESGPCSAVFEADGRVLEARTTPSQGKVIVTVADVSALTSLAQVADRSRQVIDLATVGIVTKDTRGVITGWNREASGLFGYSASEAIGRPVTMLIPPDRMTEEDAIKEKILEGARLEPFETVRLHRSGTPIDVLVAVSPVCDDRGVVVGAAKFVVGIADVVEGRRKLVESRNLAEQSMRKAEQASAAKSVFLATMSHEIRTPLNAIIGLGHMLSKEHLNESQAGDVESIVASSQHLLELINNVLDFTKIEADELEIEHKIFRVSDVLGDIKAMFSKTAQAKNLTLAVDQVPLGFPAEQVGDAYRLRQVLVNLVGNAIKFTDAGGRVGVRVAGFQGHDGWTEHVMRIEVSDTGRGIAPSDLPNLFDRFSNIGGTESACLGGSGLGLSIVRRLVELMGGRVGVESTLGEGSTFVVEVPLGVVEGGTGTDGVPRRPLRVLLVEDSAADVAFFRHAAESFHWDVEVVGSGERFVERALAARNAPAAFDCIVLDVHLPGMSGLEALAVIRERCPEFATPVVVLATPGFIRPDPLLNMPLGVDVLHKPVDASSIQRVVMNSVSVASALAMQDGRSEGFCLRGRHVLVVDDSVLNLTVMKRLLEHEGAQVLVVDSGYEAIDAVSSVTNTFDVILMDMQMPKMGGAETARRIRSTPRGKDIPIVALTAGVTLQHRAEAEAAGMIGFLSKPIDPARIARDVLRFVADRPVSPVVEPTASAASDQTSSSPGDDTWPHVDGIDTTRAREMMLDDLDLFVTAARAFVGECVSTAPGIRRLVEADDCHEASRSAHKIKGQAGMLGAVTLFEAAASLEASLVAGERNEAMMKDFETALNELTSALQRLLLERG